MPPGLSPQLNQALQATLLNCGPFSSSDSLQAIFSDARIAAWRYRLPEANSSAERVEATVDFLYRRQSEQGENALALLIRVLGEQTPPGDSCHQRLLAFAAAVEAEQQQRLADAVTPPPVTPYAGSVEIPIELQEQVAGGEVGLFVGHRLSEAAGLPSHGALVGALSRRLGAAVPAEGYDSGEHLPDVAQLYEAARGRHALVSYLREEMDTTLLQPTAAHDAIARLPVPTIFSTAQDDLLESALRQAGRRVNKVTGDSMLSHASAGRVQLLKLKGNVEMPETLVITRRDLDQYAIRHPLIVNQLRDRLASTTFLLLGYEADDPDLKLLFEQSGYGSGAGRLHYGLMAGVSRLRQQVLRERQIRVLDVAPEGVAGWVDALARYA